MIDIIILKRLKYYDFKIKKTVPDVLEQFFLLFFYSNRLRAFPQTMNITV